jgi:hypothetical protein
MIKYVFDNVRWDDGKGPGHVVTHNYTFAVFNKLINGYQFNRVAAGQWYEMVNGFMLKEQLKTMWI